MTIEQIKRKIIFKNAALIIFWLGMLGLKRVYNDFPINAAFSVGMLLIYGLLFLFFKTNYLVQYRLEGQLLTIEYMNDHLKTFERTFDLSQIIRLKYNRKTWLNAPGSVFIRENEGKDALIILGLGPSVLEKMQNEIPALNRLENISANNERSSA